MHIGAIKSCLGANGATRVEATVDGEVLWFESADLPLAPAPEAFATALLLPAASKGQVLTLDDELDTTWLANVPGVARVASDWWGIPSAKVIDGAKTPAKPALVSHSADQAPKAERTFQCFTGGVDSFYTLLTLSPPPAALVYAHGYDIPLSDVARFDAYNESLRSIAMAYGVEAVVIRTNLREHGAFVKSDWERCHGGAIAALGHLLSTASDVLVLPPSYPYHDNHPWGSHWELDYLWSSSQLCIEHGDASLRRHRKLEKLAEDPIAMRSLRVCWENKSRWGNCSRCEKCIRTRLGLYVYGALERCAAFEMAPDTLLQTVDDLPHVPAVLLSIYDEILGDLNAMGKDHRPMASAVRRLHRRSAKPQMRLRSRLSRLMSMARGYLVDANSN